MLRKHFLLVFILLAGFFFRAYKITELPLYGDELTIVYDSYSLLKTGHDSVGEKLPLTFSMGAGRPAGYVYFSIPFVFLFGPSALGVRSLSLISGVGIIFLTYLLAWKLFSKKVAIISSLLVAISPLAISLSRGGFEANFATFLALLGTYFFLSSGSKKYFYFLWAISWGIVIHTYPTFKLVLPFFFLVLLYFTGNFTKKIKNSFFVLSLVILGLFAAFSVRETLLGRSEARFLDINIFNDRELNSRTIEKVNYERTLTNMPPILTKLLLNKPLEYGYILSHNYFKNFSFDYWIFKGDGNPRHNPGEVGIIYMAEILTITTGAIYLLKEDKRKFLLLFLWITIVPLATALISGPHNLRNSFMFIPIVLLSAYGISRFNKMKRFFVFTLIFLQFVFILQRIYFLSPQKFATFWSEEAQIAAKIAKENSKKYSVVLVSSKIDNEEFGIPVYLKIDPNVASKENIRFAKGESLVKKYENVYYGGVDKNFLQEMLKTEKSVIYIGDKSESPNFEKYEIVASKDMTGGILVKTYNE